MNEFLLAAVAVLPALLVGVTTYLTTKHKQNTDRGGQLFDDALELKDEYKQAYREAADDMNRLKDEIEQLRDEVGHLIKEGEMWRNVAVAAYLEHEGDPEWWPEREPKPVKHEGDPE